MAAATHRAVWKGTLKVAEVSCPVALHAAASSADRVAFQTINRATGNPVRREYVDSETGAPVDRAAQVKGYDLGEGAHLVLTPEDLAEATPVSDKILHVQAFIDCAEVDSVYFDRPYYLAPSGPVAEETFVLFREGMRARGVAAIARSVLFRRVRSVLLRAEGPGFIATTLNFDYEVRAAGDVFAEMPDLSIEEEMLELARHIIGTKAGSFDPASFDDRYDAALADLVRAKMEGRRPAPRPAPAVTGVVDLMQALRESAGQAGKAGKAGRPRKSAPAKAASRPRRKAG